MVELIIITTTVYGEKDFYCEIKHEDVQIEFNSCMVEKNVFIKTPSDKDKIKDNIPADCLLDLQVGKPFPDIVVDDYYAELEEDNNDSPWLFSSARDFEEWFEDNNLKLVRKPVYNL